jgi:sulfide:quinone oxidoreductase
MATFVILGGGFGGLATAHGLLPAIAAGHTVTLIDRRDRFLMGLAKLWILVGERTPEEGSRELARLVQKGIRFLKSEVASIDVKGTTVRTNSGEIRYDELVIALGAETAPEAVAGLPAEANLYDASRVPALRDALARLERGKVAITVCGAPYKCPPAPFEAAMLIDALLKRHGVRDRITIEVTIPDAHPMPVAGPHAGVKVRELLASRGIELRSEAKVASVNAAAHEITFGNGEILRYDLLLAIPPHRAPRVVREAALVDATGWIPVDTASLATTHAHVHAIGDVAAVKLPTGGMLPKAGIMAERQGEIVAANLLAAHGIAGKGAASAFDGRGYCFFEIGEHRAMRVEGEFFNEPPARTRFTEASPEGFDAKESFEAERLARWFE